MALKEGVMPRPKRVSTRPRKKLITPGVSPKAKSLTASRPARGPMLFKYGVILSGELRAVIDKKWDACWPVSTLRPLALLDLICYLLFVKMLEERQLITVSPTRIPGSKGTPASELSWSAFKDMDAQNLHTLFTNENGVTDLIRNYGLTNLQYSRFLKEPLLLTPSAGLLLNAVAIVKIMEAEGSDTSVAIFEYLLDKAEIKAQSGQVYAPCKVVKLMVELMQPGPGDIIWDPTSGNGSLLANSAKYVRIKNADGNNLNDYFFGDRYNGIECDAVQLRIGAMNMMLNGIEDPKLSCVKAPDHADLSVCEPSTVVLSNLFFKGIYDGKTPTTDLERTEIQLLHLILKKLKKGGRSAIIVPEYILSNFAVEITTIRQQIIDEHNLEAVISLTTKGDILFSGAGILIFSEMNTGVHGKIWFYKMKPEVKKKKAGPADSAEMDMQEYKEEYDEITEIINQWKNVKDGNTGMRTDNSFCVPIDEIKNNNYNLCFSQYRRIEKATQPYTPAKVPIITREIITAVSIKQKVRLNLTKIKVPENIPRVMRRFALKLHEQTRPAVTQSSLQLIKQFRPYAKKFSPYAVPIALIVVIGMFFYFIVFNDTSYRPVIATNTTDNTLAGNKPKEDMHKLAADDKRPGMLSQEQIKAIVYDTTPVNHFDEQPATLEDSVEEALTSDDVVTGKSPGETRKPGTPDNSLPVNYKVKDTTSFHSQPDEGSTRKSYIKGGGR